MPMPTSICCASQLASWVDPAGEIMMKSNGQLMGAVDLSGQYVLAGHCTRVDGVAQNEPAAQGASVSEPAGQ